MESDTPSVGLVGDGDELFAIYDVERAFGVKLNKDDAPNWITAGDVFVSLRSNLSAKELSDPRLWHRFTLALCKETGVDAGTIKPSSRLILAGHPWRKIHDFLARFWILAVVSLALILLVAILTG